MWAQIINAAIGIWLMAAPAVLGYGKPASDIDRICGPIAATCAIIAWWEVTRSLRWVNLPLGLWLIAAPLVVGYNSDAASWNSMLAGAALTALSLVKGKITHSFGGGWKALFQSNSTQRGEGVKAEQMR